MSGGEEITVEVRGLRLSGRVGVTDAELEVEREIVVDLRLVPAECAATGTDAIEDTVDYAGVAHAAADALAGGPYRTLERLAAVIAETVVNRWGPRSVEVRVAKPDPPMRHRVDDVAVVLRRGT